MPRAYTVATVAVALDVETKWLDNVLTHYPIPGIPRKRQGIPRKLTSEAVLLLRIALSLADELGIAISRSLDLARRLIEGKGILGPNTRISLSLDFSEFEQLVDSRLAAAVEVAPVPRRGRPPQNKTGRLE